MDHSWLTAAFILSEAANQATFNRGINYHRLGKISDLTFHSKQSKYSAIVDGTLLYECEVILHDFEEIEYSCDCEAASTYSGACKHIIAMLFGIKDDFKEHPSKAETAPQSQSSTMLERFRSTSNNLQHSSNQTEELSVEYEFVFSYSYIEQLIEKVEIKFKIGSKRKYVVRNIEDFINVWKNNQPYTFTANFNFDPVTHHFNKQDEAIFQQLYTHLEIQATQQQPYYFRPNQKRTLEIPAVSLHSLLEKLKGASLSYTIAGGFHSPAVTIETLNNERPLIFELQNSEKMEDHLELISSNAHEFDFAEEKFGMLLTANKIYQLNNTQAKDLQIIGEHIKDGDMMDVIPNGQLEAFCSYVLPSLSSIGQVKMSDSLQQSIESKPLKAKFYLDIQDGVLIGRISFQYGEHTRNPFSKERNQTAEKIITRDVRKEEMIIDLLKQTEFTYEDGQLKLSTWESIIPFLFEEVPLLQEHLEVYTTSTVKKVIATPTSTPSVQLDVNNETNWLDVSFLIDGIPEEDIMNVLTALQSNTKYYKLSSGAYLQLNHDRFDSIRGVIQTVASSKHRLQKDMTVPLHKAFELEKDLKSTRVSKRLHELLSDIQTPEFSEWILPRHFYAELRDYQINGYRWLRTLTKVGLGGILADDMGLGKTVQTIAFLQAEKEARSSFQSLIIAPASLIYNWEREILKFAPSLKTIVIAGPKQVRKELVALNSKADVFITSYPLIQRDSDIYESHLFDTIILDEAQAIKNDTTKTTKAVRTLQAASCFALSGTPIENHQDELYSIFHSLLPGMLGTKKQFKELNHETIAKRVRPFILRRLKRDVLSELPDKIESVQYTDLSPDQKKMYVAQVKQLTSEVNAAITSNQFQQKRIEILAGLTRLRQICCHPNLVNQEAAFQSGKMERLLEYVEEGLQSGQRMVIFSQFTSMLRLIKQAFDHQGWSYHYLDGQTPAKHRVEMAEQFNNGENSLFLISLKAGGTGLNLIGGDTVILYDTWWNPAIEEQAADRVYRYGQTKNVQVVKLIANGTIEEKILDLHERKKALVDSIIQPGEETLQTLSAEDIKHLLTFA
jgi:SNF2 family DNA or RNA helicase